MNTELIKELAFKAGFCRSDAGEFSNTIIGTTYEDALKNFAELLIEECAELVEDNMDPQNAWIKPGHVKQHFAKYFGVKE